MVLEIIDVQETTYGKIVQLEPFLSIWIDKPNHNLLLGYLFDERYRQLYILKGDIVYLLDFFRKNHDIDDIFQYASSKNILNECTYFLAELQQKGFLLSDKKFDFSGFKYLVNQVNEGDKSSAFAIETILKIKQDYHLLNNISIQFGHKCNLNCRHCFNPKSEEEESISYDIAKRFIDEAMELGAKRVTLTGGECSIYDDFLDVAKYIRKRYLSLVFLTNAQLLYNDELFNEIVKLYPAEVQISLYSMDPNVHDYITKCKGSHQKTISVIKKLRENNIYVNMNCPVLTVNKYDYKQIQEFADQYKIKFNYSCLFLNNVENDNLYLKLSKEEMEEFYFEEIKKGKTRAKAFPDDSYVCSKNGLRYLNLLPNCDVTACNDLYCSLGNLKNTSLNEIWNTSVIDFEHKLIRKNLSECYKQDYCTYCNYCPRCALFEGKGFMKKSDVLCEDAQAYFNALKKYEQLQQTI